MTTWARKLLGTSLALCAISGHAEDAKHLRKELREARKPCLEAAKEACKEDHDCIKKFKIENESCKDLREVRKEIHEKRQELKKEWKAKKLKKGA